MGNSEPQTVHSSTSMSWNERFEAEFGQQLPCKGQVLCDAEPVVHSNVYNDLVT